MTVSRLARYPMCCEDVPALIDEWRSLARRHEGAEAARFHRLADQLENIRTGWSYRRVRLVDLRKKKPAKNPAG